MDVFDLTNGLSSLEETGNEHFSAKEVSPNATWTQITVKRLRNNGPVAYAQKLFYGIDPLQKKEITSSPGSIPVEDTSSSSKLSATSRLTASIALPLPKGLAFDSSNDWSEDTTNIFNQVINKLGSRDITSLSDAGNVAIDAARNFGAKMANLSGFRLLYEKQGGRAANPFKEVFYGGVRFRSFTFAWDLAPKSEAEARTIERLIYQLELASHPEYVGETDVSEFWIPDSFEIEFKGTNVPKLKPLVLTNLSVDYSQYGPKFMSDGSPAFVTLSCQFMEIDIRTKKDIREAYAGRNLPEDIF